MRIQDLIRRFTINFYNRIRLKNRNISLIASNCNGACILHDLGLEYNSPFVNLYLEPKDFLKLCYNLQDYMHADLIFLKNTDAKYPIAMLKDIKLHFMHYKTEAEASEKWYERRQRIDYQNLYFLFTDRDGCTKEDLLAFDKLPYANKAVFINHINPSIKSAVYIPGFEQEESVGVCIEYVSKWSIYKHYDAFDYVKWFNSKNKLDA